VTQSQQGQFSISPVLNAPFWHFGRCIAFFFKQKSVIREMGTVSDMAIIKYGNSDPGFPRR
jgi:hypothetical protein